VSTLSPSSKKRGPVHLPSWPRTFLALTCVLSNLAPDSLIRYCKSTRDSLVCIHASPTFIFVAFQLIGPWSRFLPFGDHSTSGTIPTLWQPAEELDAAQSCKCGSLPTVLYAPRFSPRYYLPPSFIGSFLPHLFFIFKVSGRAS
jgi:hypothetical protein